MEPRDVNDFWFVEHGPRDWWGGTPALDAEIARRFGELHALVARGEAFDWRKTPDGRLAEIIVLDQFSRQLFRNDARAFATDGMALVLAQEAIAGGYDRGLSPDQRTFLYMPLMHSESLPIHRAAEPLFAAIGGDAAKSLADHTATLERFGRYPKRNAALGRESTEAERAYIAGDGSRVF
jgi:uncharacterized protein (DUF924 family)